MATFNCNPDPAVLLAQLIDARNKILTGTAVIEVETPNLGRVQFTGKGDLAAINREIARLLPLVCPDTATDSAATRRRPISVEAWP